MNLALKQKLNSELLQCFIYTNALMKRMKQKKKPGLV